MRFKKKSFGSLKERKLLNGLNIICAMQLQNLIIIVQQKTAKQTLGTVVSLFSRNF